MRDLSSLEIRPFEPSMQDEACRLIAEGLADHFGVYDPAWNPDLADIASAYAGAIFLVALRDGAIVGTGAVRPEARGVGRVVRMSVARAMRRQGIGSRLLAALKAAAVDAGHENLVLETTADWPEVIAFYSARGFEFVGLDRERNEANFRLALRG